MFNFTLSLKIPFTIVKLGTITITQTLACSMLLILDQLCSYVQNLDLSYYKVYKCLHDLKCLLSIKKIANISKKTFLMCIVYLMLINLYLNNSFLIPNLKKMNSS